MFAPEEVPPVGGAPVPVEPDPGPPDCMSAAPEAVLFCVALAALELSWQPPAASVTNIAAAKNAGLFRRIMIMGVTRDLH